LYKSESESKTFGFSFELTGQVKAGAVLTNPSIWIDPLAAVTVQTPAVLTVDFLDGGTGKKIPSGKGVSVRLQSGNIGTYQMIVSVMADSDTIEMDLNLVITKGVP
jgi:hypothetical protein